MVSDVSVVDTATGSVIRGIEVPGAVHHVAVSPDGRIAVVTHPSGDAITAIDLGALAVIATVPTGSLPDYATFSADGARLYVSSAGEDMLAMPQMDSARRRKVLPKRAVSSATPSTASAARMRHRTTQRP